jgi:hypothetical protein
MGEPAADGGEGLTRKEADTISKVSPCSISAKIRMLRGTLVSSSALRELHAVANQLAWSGPLG